MVPFNMTTTTLRHIDKVGGAFARLWRLLMLVIGVLLGFGAAGGGRSIGRSNGKALDE